MNFTTEGNFVEAIKQFRNCIQMIPLFVASNSAQEKEAKELIKSCAEYITAMRCQIERQKQPQAVFKKNIFNRTKYVLQNCGVIWLLPKWTPDTNS